MKLKIISGIDSGILWRTATKVVNAETGELLEGVQEIDWHVSVKDIPVATIKVLNVEVDIEIDAKVEKIEWIR